MLRAHNDVAGWLFSAVGVIYDVLLGFIRGLAISIDEGRDALETIAYDINSFDPKTPEQHSVLWFALTVGAAVLALLFVVIAEFDRPFSGAVGVDMDGWTSLQERLSHVR